LDLQEDGFRRTFCELQCWKDDQGCVRILVELLSVATCVASGNSGLTARRDGLHLDFGLRRKGMVMSGQFMKCPYGNPPNPLYKGEKCEIELRS